MMKKLFIYALMIWVGVGGAMVGFGGRVWAEGGGVGGSSVDDTSGQEGDEIEISDKIPEIYIKAVNPGYVVNGVSNVGEMIEIARKDNSDTPISLAGLAVGYTNSSGNYTVLVEFPEHGWLVGEALLIRLASSPNSELANLTYTKTIALKAEVALMRGEVVVDRACWTGKEGCVKEFKSSKPTSLVRNLTSGEFEHVEDYVPEYVEGNYKVGVMGENGIIEEGHGSVGGDDEAEKKPSQCKGLMFSEILSYYETSKAEQFIELYNGGSEQILLDGCVIRYKNKNHILSGVLGAERYLAYYPADFSLTKNPTNSNKLELIDTDGAVLDVLEYPNGQRKGTSYAWIGYDGSGEELWKITYAPTPGEPNNYQEFKTCEAGKVINEATGNCVKVTVVTEKVCKEGYYLNILTGRCRKIKTTEEKTCKEGYYLNPETGRCRKIVENKGAEYGLEPEEFEEESSFVGLYAVIGVVVVGIGYLIYEFWQEIVKVWRRIWRKK